MDFSGNCSNMVVMTHAADDQDFRVALRDAFVPLARLMIARGVTIGMATELMKQGMTTAALAECGPDSDPSDSRISLLTGLHRKDVRRIRREEQPEGKKPSAMNPCSLAISRWLSDAAFHDAAGGPAVLTLARSAPMPRFADLVRAARLDLPAATVLEELTRHGIVAVEDGAATVTLVKRAYVPALASPEMLGAFSKNVGAHLAAAGENLTAEDTPPHYELGGHYNGLSAESVAGLSRFAATALQDALEAIDREAAARQQADEDGDCKERFSFGAYTHTPSPIP